MEAEKVDEKMRLRITLLQWSAHAKKNMTREIGEVL